MIKTQRVYDASTPSDGRRFLVERLWPRGVKKEEIKLDAWLKDAGPSTDLRKWFNHDPAKWKEFQKRYKEELGKNDYVETFVSKHRSSKKLTLLYAGKDEDHTHAVMLKNYLEPLFNK